MYGYYFFVFGFLGGLFLFIFLFNFDWYLVFICIVGNVFFLIKFLGFIVIVVISLVICKNKNLWIFIM